MFFNFLVGYRFVFDEDTGAIIAVYSVKRADSVHHTILEFTNMDAAVMENNFSITVFFAVFRFCQKF